MLLETTTPDEIRRGCTVYDYRTPDTTPVADLAGMVWQLSHLTPEQLSELAQQLAAADAPRAECLADALWCNLDARRQQAQRLAAVVEAERRKVAVQAFADATKNCIDMLLKGTATEAVTAADWVDAGALDD